MKKLFTILLLCASAHIALAIDISAVHFRSAGLDITSQKYQLQWAFPNPNDTVTIKNVLVLKLTIDEVQNAIFDTIDMVNNQATRYTDNGSTCCAPNAYALRLIDKNPLIPSTLANPFRTMQLSTPTLDTCANAIRLQWTPFQKLDKDYGSYQPLPDFTNEVRYHIYGYVGSSTFNPDSAVWLATSAGATNFALPVVQEKKYHHLFIAAVYNNSSDTSYSNRVQIYTPLPLRPQHITVDSVLVSSNNTTLIFHIDNSTDYTRFWAEKSGDANTGFEAFAEFNDKRLTSISNSAGGNNIVFYRVSAVNSCSQVTASSPVATSLGVGVYNNNNINNISWNQVSYNGYDATYNVYRTTPAEYAALLVSASIPTTTDDLSLLPDSIIGSTFCYTVEAITKDESIRTINYVNSVEVCNTITPQVYMPNALQLSSSAVNITTGKSRNLFEPVSSYSLTYTLYIYARTGRQIYSGNAPWNGKENNSGDFVTEGSYVYFVKITFANGSRVEKTGNVTVVY